jgi:beta-lactamase class A
MVNSGKMGRGPLDCVTHFPVFFLGVAQAADMADQFQTIEADTGGRLGVAVLDTETGRRIDYNGSARWPLCSTFKFLLVAAVLAKIDTGREQPDRMIAYGRDDMLEYAPISKANLAKGRLTVYELCQAALCHSDNTAANLLLKSIGGPEGLTGRIRAWGDQVTRVDRFEPFLNEALPGDGRDTTSPQAMIDNMNLLLLRDGLSPQSRAQLTDWLVRNTTGDARLRAGLPPPWRIGDKTGTGEHGTTNDIAIVWPSGRKPILIAAYLTGSEAPAIRRDAALADVARIIAENLNAD